MTARKNLPDDVLMDLLPSHRSLVWLLLNRANSPEVIGGGEVADPVG